MSKKFSLFNKIPNIDRFLLINIILLVTVGFIIFVSASLGLLSRLSAGTLWRIVLGHIGIGLILGSIVAYIVSRVPYFFWKKASFYLFIFACLITLLVFIPGVGVSHGGATRWLHIGPFSFQPAELLKIAYIIYLATWLTSVGKHIKTFKHGLLPFALITGLVGILLIPQPDTDTFIVIALTGGIMYFVAGAAWKHIGMSIVAGLVGLLGIIAIRPYIYDRIITFLDPSKDPLSGGYQIQQSLIAIGSGGFSGRGFGQSVQKFSFLPEPTSDSIFAVAAEEFGLIGTTIILLLFAALTLRLYILASRHREKYGKLILVAVATFILIQASMNIASMLGLMPLSGLPLLFVSHGGSALFFTFFAIGIACNISRKKGN